MSDEKKYTAREAAFAVLAKAHEMLEKSSLVKAENPDEKQDAELGERVEHLCEEHMLENRGAERKEGHRIVKSEECIKCNMKKPSPSTGQGSTLRRPASDAKWQMDKAETKHDRCVEHVKENSPDVSNPHAVCVSEGVKPSKWKKSEDMKKQAPMMPAAKPLGGTGMGAPSTPTSRPDAGFGKVIAKSDEGVGSKKIGYKPSKLGAEEKEAEQPSDSAFQQEGIDHKSSDDPRMGHTNDPDKDPKEHAEGNNPEPGSKPSVEANHSQDTEPVKGHLKLAKFIGRMEHKRSMRGAPAAAPEMDKAADYTHESGVRGVHASGPKAGVSHAGSMYRQRGMPEAQTATTGKRGAVARHKDKLAETKAMPKPKLPR